MNNITLKASGLYTFQNLLGSIPDGSLIQADNVVIDRDGVVEPRRGFNFYGSSFSGGSTTAKQLLNYKGRILRHWLTTLDYDSDGVGSFTTLSSSITEQATGTRIKFLEANGNFYFTTNSGIMKISSDTASNVVSNGITRAGGIKALDGVATLNSTEGFFVQDSTCAYRVVWGITDTNQNVVLGAPSPIIIVTNPMVDLIVSDYNNLLADLSTVAAADPTQALTDTSFAGNKMSGSSATVLYNGLLALAAGSNNQLDTDLSLSGVNVTTTANSTSATVTSSKNIQVGMLLSGNLNLATTTTIQLTTTLSSSLAYTNSLTGLSSGMLLSNNSNIPSGTTISSVAAGVIINTIGGNSFIATATTADYFDLASSSTSTIYRFWFQVGSSTAPSGSGVTLEQVTVLTTDSDTDVATKLAAVITGLGVFTVVTNNNILSITGGGINSPLSVVADTSFSLTLTNLILSNLAVATGSLSTTAASSTLTLTTTAGLLTATASSTIGISAGTLLSGNSNIANGTTVASVAADGITLTLSQAALTSGTAVTGLNNVTVIAVNNATTITLSSPAYASGTASTDFLNTTFQNIPVPSAPNNPPLTQDLVAIQNYYDAIVNALNIVAGISSTGRAAIGGSFSNSTQSATVNLTFTVPQDVTTEHFYQIYRSPLAISSGPITLSNVSPSDEEQLVYENNPTSGQISAKSITYVDIVPETFREGGANLYTNANSGSGILQANEIPPLAQDIALYRGCTFYANTISKQSLQLNLLTGLNVAGHTLTITEGSTVNTYSFVTNTAQVVTVTTVAGSFYISSGTADYFDLFSVNNATTYRFWFQVGTSVAPSGAGVTLVECAVLTGDTNAQVAAKLQNAINSVSDFFASTLSNVITVDNTAQGYATAPSNHVANSGFSAVVATAGAGENAATNTVGVSTAPTPAQQVDETARSLCRVINKNASEVVYAFYISSVTSVPGQINLENRYLGKPAFTLISTIGTAFSPTLPTSGTSIVSDNQISPNRIWYSTIQQPEAVPIVNYQDVGPKDKAILRILPLRDSVFILSENGVYQLTGTDPTTFQIVLFDGTTHITSADSAVVLNNQIYVLTDQGVVTISSTGVSIISRPIENLILPVAQYANFSSATFGVSYSTDRSYLLGTVTNPTDTLATQMFRFNAFTNTWTRWPISKTCGTVPPETNILYLGAGDTNYVEQERKTFTRSDHADRSYSLSITAVAGDNIAVAAQSGAAAGDVLVQTQYLTIAQFNRLLGMLDRDPGVNQKNYASTLTISAGVNIRNSLTTLAAKIDTDTGINDSGFSAAISGYSSSFADCQSAYNVITARLNASSQGLFKNYPTSSGTIPWEIPIASVNSTYITSMYPYPLILGPVVLYDAIISQTTWAPHSFGDPTMLKHTNESTILFQNVAFSKATAAYASDLSTGYDEIPIVGEGTGIWGGFVWGDATWGGVGSSRPFRTFIPVNKQRSRYLNCQFTHAAAREQYSIFGISYSYNPVSNKAYR